MIKKIIVFILIGILVLFIINVIPIINQFPGLYMQLGAFFLPHLVISSMVIYLIYNNLKKFHNLKKNPIIIEILSNNVKIKNMKDVFITGEEGLYSSGKSIINNEGILTETIKSALFDFSHRENKEVAQISIIKSDLKNLTPIEIASLKRSAIKAGCYKVALMDFDENIDVVKNRIEEFHIFS
jgi:hypothetical protein